MDDPALASIAVGDGHPVKKEEPLSLACHEVDGDSSDTDIVVDMDDGGGDVGALGAGVEEMETLRQVSVKTGNHPRNAAEKKTNGKRPCSFVGDGNRPAGKARRRPSAADNETLDAAATVAVTAAARDHHANSCSSTKNCGRSPHSAAWLLLPPPPSKPAITSSTAVLTSPSTAVGICPPPAVGISLPPAVGISPPPPAVGIAPPAVGRASGRVSPPAARKVGAPTHMLYRAPAPAPASSPSQPLHPVGENIATRKGAPSVKKNARPARTCGKAGCLRRPSFGYPGDVRPSWCAAHKAEGQVDITSRRCESGGCSRIPSFRHSGDKGSRFCAAHKEPGMEDYHRDKRRCLHPPGCNRNPSFGMKGGKRTSCATHRSAGMVNLNIVKCRGPNCSLTPYFGFPGTSPSFCASHQEPGMKNVVSRRCQAADCDRIPSYGWDGTGTKASFCAPHKIDGMVNVRHPRCTHPDCRRQPGFGLPGGKIALFCKEHKGPDMVDVKNNYVKRKARAHEESDMVSVKKKYDKRKARAK